MHRVPVRISSGPDCSFGHQTSHAHEEIRADVLSRVELFFEQRPD